MSTFTEGTPIPIKELLIEATFAPKRALRVGVEAIDLGVLGQEAERIHDRSVSEAKLADRVEYNIPAVVTNDGRLLLRREVSGKHNSCEYQFEIYLKPNYPVLPKRSRQQYFLGAQIHNHPYPVPLSPNDLSSIFLEDSDPWGGTAAFMVSEVEKMVFFRGEGTPELNRFEMESVCESWIRSIYSSMEDYLGLNLFKRLNFLMTGGIPVSRRIQMDLLNEAVSKYDLQAFSCPLRENIARRMEFPQK